MMTINDAVARRIIKLLIEKNITQYRKEKKSGVQHGAMNRILAGKNKTITMTTLYRIAKGFDMTLIEFLNDSIFDESKVNYED